MSTSWHRTSGPGSSKAKPIGGVPIRSRPACRSSIPATSITFSVPFMRLRASGFDDRLPMADSALEPAEQGFLRALNELGVRYMIVGVTAASMQGARIATEDIDLWFEDLAD